MASGMEVPSTNVGPDTGSVDRIFAVSISHARQIPQQYLKLCHDPFLPHPFPFIIHVSSYYLLRTATKA